MKVTCHFSRPTTTSNAFHQPVILKLRHAENPLYLGSGLAEMQTARPHPQVSDSGGLGGAKESAFLMSS